MRVFQSLSQLFKAFLGFVMAFTLLNSIGGLSDSFIGKGKMERQGTLG